LDFGNLIIELPKSNDLMEHMSHFTRQEAVMQCGRAAFNNPLPQNEKTLFNVQVN
jgi:hypothetical protein